MYMSDIVVRSMAFASAFFCVAALADYVVLESNSEQFIPGQIVTDLDAVEVGADTQLVLMSREGQTLSIDGSLGTAGESASSSAAIKLMLANLVTRTRDEHVSLGGTRGGMDSSSDNDTPVWSLNPYISGIQCVIERVNAHVYRTDTGTDLELTVSRPGTNDSGLLNWSEGEHETEWPDEVPVVDGERYVIKREGWMESSVLQLQSIPEIAIDKETAAVAWLAAKKCIPQAEKLLNMLE